MDQQMDQQKYRRTPLLGGRKWERKVVKRSWLREGQRQEAAQYSLRIAHDGRRDWVNLLTLDLREAGRRAAAFVTVLKANGWDAAYQTLGVEPARIAVKREVPTVGEVIAAAESLATNVRPLTLRYYSLSLRQVAAMVVGIKGDPRRFNYRDGGGLHEWRRQVDSVSIGALTPRAVESAAAGYVKARGGTDSSKRSIAAILRMARGFWSRRMARVLPFENLPNPFTGVSVASPRPPRYAPGFNSRELVAAARRELRRNDAECWKAFLLCLSSGLRRGEADRLQWVDVDVVRRVVCVGAGAKSWESAAEVPISDETAEELERLRPDACGVYVLEGGPRPGPNAKHRIYGARPTWQRLLTWLRLQGINDQKPNHTLRKEAGALINAIAGIHAASRFLRHADLAVTSGHYADNRIRVVVPLFKDHEAEAK